MLQLSLLAWRGYLFANAHVQLVFVSTVFEKAQSAIPVYALPRLRTKQAAVRVREYQIADVCATATYPFSCQYSRTQ